MADLKSLFNTYYQKLSPTIGKLSSFIQQNPTPAGFLSKQVQPAIQPLKNYASQVQQNIPHAIQAGIPALQLTNPENRSMIQKYAQKLGQSAQETIKLSAPLQSAALPPLDLYKRITQPSYGQQTSQQGLNAGLSAMGTAWRANPLAIGYGATFGAVQGVRKGMNPEQIVQNARKGVVNQPFAGEAVTDDPKLQQIINLGFMGAQLLHGGLKMRQEKLNAVSQKVKEQAIVKDVPVLTDLMQRAQTGFRTQEGIDSKGIEEFYNAYKFYIGKKPKGDLQGMTTELQDMLINAQKKQAGMNYDKFVTQNGGEVMGIKSNKPSTGGEIGGTTVYHGTNKTFDNFDINKSGSNQGLDNGTIFFTSDKNRAKTFSADYPQKPKYQWNESDKQMAQRAEQMVKEANINTKDSLTLQEVSELYKQGKIKTKPVVEGLVRPESAFDNNRKSIKEAAQVTGKKVFKFTSEGETQYAVFDTSLISQSPLQPSSQSLRQQPLSQSTMQENTGLNKSQPNYTTPISGEIPKGVTPVVEKVGTSPKPMRTGEETVLSEAQAQKQAKAITNPVAQESEALPDIIQRGSIDVKDKVNLLDYLRTPDRVMKKIGLENESNLIRKKYNDYLTELPVEIDKITQWSKQVSPESNQRIFQFLDGKKIELNPQENKVAGEIKSYLGDWADRLKLPKENRITNYITHIFDKDLIKKEFDPELAKLLENRISGSVYDPFTEQRLGKLGYKEDTWAALDAYVKRATRKVNMDEALSVVKDKAKNLELSQYNYVKQYIDRINMRPTDVDNLLDNTLKSVVGYKFGARPTTELTKKARQAVYRGTLGLNVGSAIKNLTQGSNTYARLGEKYTILGYLKNAAKIAAGDNELQKVGVLRDEFIQDRTLNATKKFWEKTDKGLFMFFEMAEKINRGSAYFGAKAQALDKGLPEQQAIDYALKTVRDTQFTFGSVDTPPVLASDIAKFLLQFQSFSLKQGEFLGEMVSKKDLVGLIRYGLASALMTTTVGKLIGMKWSDFIPSVRIGLPPTLSAPVEIGKALMGTPDKFGNVPDVGERVKNVGNSLIPFIPGGVQLKKTIGGLSDVARGFAQNAKGNVKYPVAQTPSNAVRGGLFGPYNLPEAQANKGVSPLTEKQSNVFKQSQDRQNVFKTFVTKREETKADTQAKDELKASNQSVLEKNNKVYILQPNGDIRTIDPSFQPSKPNLTGNTELDKKLTSKYNSEITSKVNDFVSLYEAGKMTAAEAEKAIKEVKSKSIKTGKGKIKTIRFKKVTLPKIKKSTIKKISIKPYKIKKYALKKIKLKKVSLT